MSNAFRTQHSDVWQNPAWYLCGVDLNQAVFHFHQLSRNALSASPFLDERIYGQDAASQALHRTVSFADLAAPETTPLPASFVFHTAFCCSTLLASVLDRPGRVLALKEPEVLMTVANLWRTSGQRRQLENLTQLSLQLLSRRFESNEQILLKPTNAASNLLESALRSGAQVLLLYSDLPSFLISVLKKGEACRYYVRHLLNILRLDRADIDGWPDRQRMLLTDLQVAALVWSIQIDHFQGLLQTASSDQIRTLNADTFLEHPGKTLSALNNHFGFGYDDATLGAMAASPRFQQHAKFSEQDYDSNVRAAERSQVREQFAEAIATTLDWTRQLRNDPLPDVLPGALKLHADEKDSSGG